MIVFNLSTNFWNEIDKILKQFIWECILGLLKKSFDMIMRVLCTKFITNTDQKD